MKANIFYLIAIILTMFLSCNNNRSKKNLDFTTKVCDEKLFVEVYKIFESGALGGDRVSSYLTDSINFRKYLGTYDDAKESIATECNGDSVNVYRQIMDPGTNRFKIVNAIVFSLSELRKKKIFE
jgi:hypothetical protein